LQGEPLSPLNIPDETHERSESSPEYPATSDVQTHEEGFAEAPRVVSPGVQLRSLDSGSEGDLHNEEPDQCTTLDLGTSIPKDTPLGGTSIPSTSGAGPSVASCTFDFLGVRLLGDPLEAIASILPDGFFEDIGRTTPFKFAQDIIESQIVVFSLCILLALVLFSPSYFSFIFFVSRLSSICHRLVQFSGAHACQP
jgi:hypothetical protein